MHKFIFSPGLVLQPGLTTFFLGQNLPKPPLQQGLDAPPPPIPSYPGPKDAVKISSAKAQPGCKSPPQEIRSDWERGWGKVAETDSPASFMEIQDLWE